MSAKFEQPRNETEKYHLNLNNTEIKQRPLI